MIRFKHKGNFSKTIRYFERVKDTTKNVDFTQYGELGVAALAAASPVDTGRVAQSWYYEIVQKDGRTEINFNNSDIENGCPIAIVLQYGHATRNGGWVEGIDYINPALQPVFDQIANDAWKEVTKV